MLAILLIAAPTALAGAPELDVAARPDELSVEVGAVRFDARRYVARFLVPAPPDGPPTPRVAFEVRLADAPVTPLIGGWAQAGPAPRGVFASGLELRPTENLSFYGGGSVAWSAKGEPDFSPFVGVGVDFEVLGLPLTLGVEGGTCADLSSPCGILTLRTR